MLPPAARFKSRKSQDCRIRSPKGGYQVPGLIPFDIVSVDEVLLWLPLLACEETQSQASYTFVLKSEKSSYVGKSDSASVNNRSLAILHSDPWRSLGEF